FEISTAALMRFPGMIREEVECFHNIRSRYDGFKRSPWDEAECGHHYARAMASWALVLTCSGFDYDGRSGELRFGSDRGRRRHVFSTGDAWGTCVVDEAGAVVRLEVMEGSLS